MSDRVRRRSWVSVVNVLLLAFVVLWASTNELVEALLTAGSVAATVAMVLTLIAVLRAPEDRLRAGSQIVWIVLVVFLPVIGTLLYWAMGAPTQPRSLEDVRAAVLGVPAAQD